ncbi:MAG: hypothetical protein QOC81_2141 [Thermoanaerobaculia bacterium]|nr:hypothetical protein [Thermoanaerobaculia bacterium]
MFPQATQPTESGIDRHGCGDGGERRRQTRPPNFARSALDCGSVSCRFRSRHAAQHTPRHVASFAIKHDRPAHLCKQHLVTIDHFDCPVPLTRHDSQNRTNEGCSQKALAPLAILFQPLRGTGCNAPAVSCCFMTHQRDSARRSAINRHRQRAKRNQPTTDNAQPARAAQLSRRPAQIASAEEVEVDVEDGLAGVFAVVCDHAVALAA